MKYFFLSICILLFSKNIAETVDTQMDLEKKQQQEIAKEKINEYLKSLDLVNKKTLTREEVVNIFRTIYEISIDSVKDLAEEREKHLEKAEKIANQVYNILYTKDKDVIEIDKIMEFLSLKTIKNYINTFFSALGIDKFLETYGKPILHLIEEIYNNYYKSTEL